MNIGFSSPVGAGRSSGSVGLAVLAACSFLGLVGAGCGRRARAPGGQARPEEVARGHARSEAARWTAVALPNRLVRKALKGFSFKATAEVASTLDGKPEKSWTERYGLECAARGDCHGRLDLSLEVGVEFFRLGDETYFRHRYQPFLRFREEPEESERRVEHIWSGGPAVLALLRPWVRLEAAGSRAVAGRGGRVYRLVRRAKPRPVRGVGRRAWRRQMVLDKVSGQVVLEQASGALLRLRVTYAIHAPKGAHVVGIAGKYEGDVLVAGKDPKITPPAKYTRARPRERDVIWERRLLGSGPLHPGWFRGGGPYEARRRRRGHGSAPRRAPSRRPASSLQRPASSPQRPASSPQRPAASPQRPAASPQRPAAPGARASGAPPRG